MAIERITNIVGLGVDKAQCCYFDVQDFNVTTDP